MDTLVPVPISYENLARLLAEITDHVRMGDSFEGQIEYLLPVPYDGMAEDVPFAMVRGMIRMGNRRGEGGLRMIGALPPVSVLPPTSEELR